MRGGGFRSQRSGSEKGVFWERGLFRRVHVLEILEIENLEILERAPTVWKTKPNSTIFLEIPENLVMTPFSGPELGDFETAPNPGTHQTPVETNL